MYRNAFGHSATAPNRDISLLFDANMRTQLRLLAPFPSRDPEGVSMALVMRTSGFVGRAEGRPTACGGLSGRLFNGLAGKSYRRPSPATRKLNN